MTFSLDVGTQVDATMGTITEGVGDGIITLTNGMTWVSLASTINSSQNWRMVLVGARPEDVCFATDKPYIMAVSSGTNAAACYTEPTGTTLSFATAATQHASVVLGPEAETGSAFAPVHQRMSEESIVYKRDVTDVKDAAFANHIADQSSLINTCAFLVTGRGRAGASSGTAVGAVTIYAATQTSSRILYTAGGAAANESLASASYTTLASSDLGYDPLITEPGERIIFRYADAAANTTNAAQADVTGGYGYLLA